MENKVCFICNSVITGNYEFVKPKKGGKKYFHFACYKRYIRGEL